MKIDRLIGILIYLLNRNIVSAKALAEKFEVSQRTVQRDIDALNLAGIPIVSVVGANGGYGIAEGFRIDRQLASYEDFLHIITALKGLSTGYGNKKLDNTLEKMIAVAPPGEEYSLSGFVEAGDFVFLSFCVGNVGQSVENQVEGALDNMSARLEKINLTLDAVVKVDVLLRDVWDIPVMEEVFKRRFRGKYPARKTISTEFAHHGGPNGLKFQIDGIAYKGKRE